MRYGRGSRRGKAKTKKKRRRGKNLKGGRVPRRTILVTVSEVILSAVFSIRTSGNKRNKSTRFKQSIRIKKTWNSHKPNRLRFPYWFWRDFFTFAISHSLAPFVFLLLFLLAIWLHIFAGLSNAYVYIWNVECETTKHIKFSDINAAP